MMRAYKLFGSSEMRPITESRTGLDLDCLFRLGIACSYLFLDQPNFDTNQNFSVLRVSDEEVASFFELFSASLKQHRAQTEDNQCYDGGWVYGFNTLHARPLVRLDPNRSHVVTCPIPTLLQHRFTDGLFYDAVEHDDFSNAFGRSFELYVGEVLRKTLDRSFAIRPEQKYRVGKDSKHGPDWVVSDETGHLFIECKTKRLPRVAKFTSGDNELSKELDILSEYIVKHYRNIDDMRLGRTSWIPDDKPIIPLILTLENWWLFLQPIVEKLTDRLNEKFDKLKVSSKLLAEMPYIIASIDEFETAAMIVSKTGIAEYFVPKQSKHYRTWALTVFTQERFGSDMRDAQRELFPEEWDKFPPLAGIASRLRTKRS